MPRERRPSDLSDDQLVRTLRSWVDRAAYGQDTLSEPTRALIEEACRRIVPLPEALGDGLAAVGEPAFTIGGEVHYQGGDCCRVIGQRCSCRGRLHVHHPSGGGARYVCEDCGAET